MQADTKSRQLLLAAGVGEKVSLLGMRGYFRDTMGKPGVNDRGIYDDAIFLVSPTAYVAFNANTDPSIARPGVAVLRKGLWRYKIGIHGLSKPMWKRYKALVQAAAVIVVRDGGRVDTGYFGINIHKGSRNSTSSLGCQTIWPEQWNSFISLIEQELSRYNQATIPYLLVEGQG